MIHLFFRKIWLKICQQGKQFQRFQQQHLGYRSEYGKIRTAVRIRDFTDANQPIRTQISAKSYKNGLLIEREVSTVKYWTEVFTAHRASAASEVCSNKPKSNISLYRLNMQGQYKPVFIWLINRSFPKKAFSSVTYASINNKVYLEMCSMLSILSWLVNGSFIMCVKFSFV